MIHIELYMINIYIYAFFPNIYDKKKYFKPSVS